MANWVLATHAHQGQTEAENYPQEIFGCSMSSVAAVTIPKTQPLHYTKRHQGLKMATGISRCIRKVSEWATKITRVRLRGSLRAGIKRQAPDASLTIKKGTDRTTLDEELPVLMIKEIEEQQDVEMEYFDQEQPDNGRDRDRMDSYGREAQPPTLRKLLEARENDLSYAQAALTVELPKSVLRFDTESALF